MMLAKRAPHTCFRFSTTLQYQHIKLATPHKASIKPDIPQFHGDQTQLITTLGLCAGQLVLSGMAEASPAIAVEGQQGISLPLLLLGGLLLVAGAMNGVFTVMKTAIEKQSQQQLLDKALTRHNNFVNGVDNLDVTNEEVITEQEEQQQDISSTQMGTGKSGIQIQSTEQAELESVQEGGQVLAVAASSAEMVSIPEDRTLSAHSLTSTFQTGVGKTGVCDRSGQPIAEGETNIGRAFAVATPPSEPVQYSNQVSSQDSSTPSQSQEYVPYSISEVRSLSAHSLLASFQTGLGKTGYSSWSGKYKFKPVLKTGHGYWLSTTPTEYSKEDLTQNEIDSKQVGFSNLVGKVGESSWTQTLKSEEAAEKVTPYESATEASEPVSLETHYQYITSRTQPSDAVEQQAQKEEVVEKVVEDRSEAGEVMKSEFEKSLGRVGSAGFSEKQVTEEAVTRAQLELVETEVSHPVSQHIVEEVEEEAKEEEEEVTPQLSKNPLVRLIQAILNFFKWLWNLLFGGGSSSGSKPAAA
eukprot:TRINITY_DN1503_c0_g1_i3.p1 TRINITY_DN1503_c0_g1~~TRINITY_DN1503_c0_g1_i3.p1  ORF type:complete len:525 (-),score=110.82 TRINITY_DN1503_c0_g1_i3:439-2013(-)